MGGSLNLRHQTVWSGTASIAQGSKAREIAALPIAPSVHKRRCAGHLPETAFDLSARRAAPGEKTPMHMPVNKGAQFPGIKRGRLQRAGLAEATYPF